jgi:dsRNA-specific ribonuclease
MRASQTVSYDKHENYESMETLGDCVLKFVVSQYLVNRGKKGKWRNERYLTE